MNHIRWTQYNKPPQECIEAVGKHFVDKRKGIEVVVSHYGLLVEYLLRERNDETGYDVPTVSQVIFSFEVVSGYLVGQKLSMTAHDFFEQFALKEIGA